MDFLQNREWGLMILDGQSLHLHFALLSLLHVNYVCILSTYVAEVQTIPADKFRRVLSGEK